ncbi:hypothetical protein P8C59_007589 [Phyllachora maydis]|uniref:Reverse transcriptase Ty1/copia-type domain-containing protein n=1 Tax=Phyllachora maydis TaxID=1825666 RepID=A0AAD9I9T4_9PEZI|nr:hypothetical protein P8C59_007589 [Phyllachora maydis]
MLGSYNLAIEEEEESDFSSNSSSSSDSDTQLAQLLALKGYKKRKDFKGKGLKTSSNNKAKYKDNQPRRRPRDPALYNSWLYNPGSTDHISNSKEQFTTFTPNIGQLRPINTGNGPVLYLPNININIVSRVRHYDLGGCLIKETLYGGDRRCIAVLDFKKSGFFLNVKGSSKPILYANFAFPLGLSSYTTKSIEPQCNKIVVEIPSNSIRKEDYRPIIKDAIVSEAIEPNKRYKLRNSPAKGTTLEVLKTSTVKFIEDNTVRSQPTDNTALEGELVDLDLDLEGAISPNPSNLNTEKPISIDIGPSKLEPYKSSSDKPIFAPKPIEVIAPNQPIMNEPLDNSNLILEGDKMQLDYYKLLAKTSSYILSFIYKARKRVISKDKLGVFKFLPRSLLPSNCKLITCRNVLKVKKDAKNRPIKYKSRLVARGFMQVEGLDYTVIYASTSIPPTWRILLAIGAVLDWEIEQADFIGAFLNSVLREEIYIGIPKGLLDLAASNKAIYKLLLKYGYNPSTPNIIKLSKALYGLKQSPREWQDKLKILLKSLGYLPLISDLGFFYNAKTCRFIVTYIDDCLFIGPDIGYITDLKKQLNKVYAIEDLGPAAYFLGV